MKNAVCVAELDGRKVLPQKRTNYIPSEKSGGIFLEENMEYTNSQIAELIDEHVHKERDRAILKRRLIDGVIFEKLAEEFDLSVRQTKNIVYKSQEQLFRHVKF